VADKQNELNLEKVGKETAEKKQKKTGQEKQKRETFRWGLTAASPRAPVGEKRGGVQKKGLKGKK